MQGLALRDPVTYAGYLDGVVSDWVDTLEALLVRDGVAQPRARALATLLFAAARGLLLDLLSTGDRPRVEAAFAALEGEVARALEVRA